MHVQYFIFTTEIVFFTECLTLNEGIFALVKNFTKRYAQRTFY
jgi:hypothetical protein